MSITPEQARIHIPFAEMNAVECRQWLSARRSMKMRKGEDLDLQDETLWRARRLNAMTAQRSTPLGYLGGV
jgi:hypothetical protein